MTAIQIYLSTSSSDGKLLDHRLLSRPGPRPGHATRSPPIIQNWQDLRISAQRTSSLQRLVESSNGRVVFVKLDATNESDINNVVKHVESVLGSNGGLDVLINNAGVMPFTPGGVQAMTDLDEVMRTNVTSAQMVTSAFLPLLSKGAEKKVFDI